VSKRAGGLAHTLRTELGRMQSPSPFDVLRVPPHASGEAVRSAFLAAVKKYHPTRFARESADIVDLATEIFLAIRKAYGNLNDEAKRRAWRDRTMAVLAPPATQPPARTLTPAAGIRIPPTQPPARTPTPGMGIRIPATQPPAAASPPATQPPMAPRPPATQPPMAPRPSAAGSRSPATQPPVGGRSQSVPVVQPAVTLRPPSAPRPKPPTVPPRRPAPGEPARDVQAMLDLVRTRSARTEHANALIVDGRFTEAREALQQLTAEEPQNRKLRQRLHLAWGLEHRAAQRYEDAVRELERAITFDPTSNEVHDALRVTRDQRDAARGLFGKFFGR